MTNLQDIYMNTMTGSTDTLENWLDDYDKRDDRGLTWEQWEDGVLAHVELINGDWVKA